MPRLWRLFRTTYGPGLDGIGGTFAEGRWHSRGERVVYFGGSAAIVVLEGLAHIDPDLLPDDLRLGLFELQGAALDMQPPDGWMKNENWSRRAGNIWLRSSSSCLLAVPSAILPEETNYVFNPRHPDANSLRMIRERPFSLDPRLL